MYLLIVLSATVACCLCDENALKFLVVGDWGGVDTRPYYTAAQWHVAEQMGSKAEEIGADFTVSVGDNFYGDGVQNVDDPRFKETFEVSHTRDTHMYRYGKMCRILL